MEVIRTLERRGGLFRLSIRAVFNAEELAMIRRYRLANFRVATRDAAFEGILHSSRNMRGAYRALIGRVRGRWSPALVRTTGFTLTDVVSSLAGMISGLIRAIINLVLGRRARLADAMRGMTVVSSNVVDAREAEMFILLSLASIEKAILYISGIGTEKVLSSAALMSELEGLDFAGAGTELEKSRSTKIVLTILLVIVAAIAAMQALGTKLQQTFVEQAAHQTEPGSQR